MDSPEITRYFFKAFAKSLDSKIIPIPSYSPLGNGTAIGTMVDPKIVSTPSSTNLLDDIGASNSNTHLSKNVMIVGYEGVDAEGNAFDDNSARAPLMLVVDPDGKFELSIDCDPNSTKTTAVVDVVSGLINFEKGIISISNTRCTESEGKITGVKFVCSAVSSEHNIAPKIVLDGKQIKIQAQDIQLSSEWSDQYAYDSATRKVA